MTPCLARHWLDHFLCVIATGSKQACGYVFQGKPIRAARPQPTASVAMARL